MFPVKTKILIVDDMRMMRSILKKYLADCGLKNVTEAFCGRSAWSELEVAASRNVPFQLVIADWNMPEMNGLDLLKKLRASHTMKTMPFVFVTAQSELSNVQEAIDLGISQYITKPFTANILIEKLTAVHLALTAKT